MTVYVIDDYIRYYSVMVNDELVSSLCTVFVADKSPYTQEVGCF